jgi:hypothetical protein
VEEDEAGSGSGDNPRDDPDCWYGDLYVCDESGNCDTENFDCITDCEDGSSVTTGEECPGDDDSDEPADDEGSDGGDAEEEDAEEVYVDDVEDFEGEDSQETAEGEREYDEEGDSICGNDETGEEWSC